MTFCQQHNMTAIVNQPHFFSFYLKIHFLEVDGWVMGAGVMHHGGGIGNMNTNMSSKFHDNPPKKHFTQSHNCHPHGGALLRPQKRLFSVWNEQCASCRALWTNSADDVLCTQLAHRRSCRWQQRHLDQLCWWFDVSWSLTAGRGSFVPWRANNQSILISLTHTRFQSARTHWSVTSF